jgi:ApaG protein
MYSTETRGIAVTVTPEYSSERSDPESGAYFWAYTIEIRNNGAEPVWLRSRLWRIIDGLGRVREVTGPGVVGEQPRIAPGEAYRYTSGCPLTTPSGIMEGTYTMQTEAGTLFDAAIPAFSLDLPDGRRVIN